MIKEADAKRFISLASSAGEETQQESQMKNVGLVSDHAYTILAVHEIQHKGKKLRLLKLRNPWGHQEWSGDWSDQSSQWTDELRTKLNHKKQDDDGVFFISFEDYLSYYRSTTICKLHEGGYTTKTLKVKPNTQKTYQVISVKMRDRSKVYFSVIQRSARFAKNNRKGAGISCFVKMFLAKDINYDTLQPLEYLYSKCQNSDSVTLELQNPLPVGEYVILVEVDWGATHTEKDRKYVL